MTLRQYFSEKLEGLGIWPEDASTIMDEVEAHPLLESMRGRLDEPQGLEYYGEPVITTTWISIRYVATEWTKRNKPEAWWLPLIDDRKNGGNP